MMRVILDSGELKEMLDEAAVKIAGRGEKDTAERHWYIVFCNGYYGEYNTAYCELEGSPVKCRILVDISHVDTPRCGSIVVLSGTMDIKRRCVAGNPQTSKTSKIIRRMAMLRDKLQTELRKEAPQA